MTSFDKANRSSTSSYRGPGISEGLRILKSVRDSGIPVLTDIHEPAQAELAAEAVDVLQIPAFLCRQTDLPGRRTATGRIVNIKKGQFVAPQDIQHAAIKVASTGNNKILITERGSSFGYNNLVVDMRGLAHHGAASALARWFLYATHSVQLPGSAGTFRRPAPVHRPPLPRRRGRGLRRAVRRSP